MRLVLCLLFACLAGAARGAEAPIEVLKVEGGITLSDSSGKESKPVQAGSVLPRGAVLSTGPNARAVVRVGSDGIIVVGNSSRVEINKTEEHTSFFRQVTGVIYYALNAIKGRNPIEVRTTSATLGVRGTRFLVTETEARNEVGMRKGVVNVTSPEGEFELHKQAEQSEFEAYKREAKEAMDKQKREFEEYKAKTQHEFIEYKREFSLGANRMASFDGKRVLEKPLSEESKKDMESFESYADEWLKQVQD
jgi:hypothetical protein